ncbi:MAG: hypothetical protein PHU86_03755 [Patescibacteria group bacterium]|nr:hypothetical protein [Patescibacteria group bacterium]
MNKEENINPNCPTSKPLTITGKISARVPVLYTAIIQYDLVDEKEFENMSAFINHAVRKELLNLGFNLKVTEIPSGWFDGTEKGGCVPTPIRNKIIPYKKRRRYFG